MASSNHITFLDYTPASSLFKRCLQCPPAAPSCPNCKSDEVCSQTLGDGCTTCASASCVKTLASGSTSANAGGASDGPNLGAIIGGVIGGVAFIAIAVFCIWKFWLKGRRHDVEPEEEWDDPDYPLEKPAASTFTRDRASRASTHTVGSMASTVLTRASNIIQIAYIPGVTNRTGSSDPTLLVPPVPPIPSAMSPSSLNSQFSPTSSSGFEDQHFFMPGDLRDSTYSDTSRMSSFTEAGARRPGSIASSLARSSVATTIYRDSAVLNPMPATQIISAKPAMVSVIKGSPAYTPPVPAVDFAKHRGVGAKPIQVQMPGSGGGGSATSSLRTMKPVALNIIRSKPNHLAPDTASMISGLSSPSDSRKSKRFTKDSLAPSEMSVDTHRRARQSGYRSSHLSGNTDYSSDEEGEFDHERSRRSLLEGREEATASPFTDAAEVKNGEGVERGKSPFEDEHRIK